MIRQLFLEYFSIGILVKNSQWKQICFSRATKCFDAIMRIMRILKCIRFLLEPLIGIHLVEHRAGLENIHERKSFMEDSFFDNFFRLRHIAHKCARHK